MKTPQNFIYPDIKETDFVFGSNQLSGAVLNLERDWRPFTPPYEAQNRNGVESSVCFIEALQHTIATLLEKKFGILDQNFSARFNAIFSNATPQGGDPLKAAQSFRDKGLIPDTMLPFSNDIKSWQEFVSFKGGDREACEKQGKTWRSYWTPSYDIVVKREMDVKLKYARLREALLYSPCPVSVAQGYNNGQPKPKGISDIHLVELLYIDDKGYPTILDTYPPFIKTLAPYYNFDFGMRLSVEKNTEQEQLGILSKILNLLLQWTGLIKIEPKVVEPIRVSTPFFPEQPKYDWDTPTLARHSVRVICDEMGLTVAEKNLICAVIACESGFDTKAVRQNKDKRKSKDYGICQYNSYWYIGEGKPIPSIDVALNDPEFCVRTMIKRYKAGWLKDWVCYSRGLYKQHL